MPSLWPKFEVGNGMSLSRYFFVSGIMTAFLNKGMLPFNEEALIALTSFFFFSSLYLVLRGSFRTFFFMQADAIYVIFAFLMRVTIRYLFALHNFYSLVRLGKILAKYNLNMTARN